MFVEVFVVVSGTIEVVVIDIVVIGAEVFFVKEDVIILLMIEGVDAIAVVSVDCVVSEIGIVNSVIAIDAALVNASKNSRQVSLYSRRISVETCSVRFLPVNGR